MKNQCQRYHQKLLRGNALSGVCWFINDCQRRKGAKWGFTRGKVLSGALPEEKL